MKLLYKAQRSILLGLMVVAQADAKSDLLRLFDKAKKEINHVVDKNAGANLSTAEVTEGLREALKVGANSAGSRGSKIGGFLGNPRINIPLPKELASVGKFLNDIGMKQLTDDFVTSMNRGAETAAHLAAPIFIHSITHMTFSDAKGILGGSENSATKYLKRTCSPELAVAFTPVVAQALGRVNATKYWNRIRSTYNSAHVFGSIHTDLNEYVTGKAMEGLFTLMADEEKKIRRDPLGQASEIIRKVFGANKN